MSRLIVLFAVFLSACKLPDKNEFVEEYVDHYCECGRKNCESYSQLFDYCDYDAEAAAQCLNELAMVDEDYCGWEPIVCTEVCE